MHDSLAWLGSPRMFRSCDDSRAGRAREWPPLRLRMDQTEGFSIGKVATNRFLVLRGMRCAFPGPVPAVTVEPVTHGDRVCASVNQKNSFQPSLSLLIAGMASQSSTAGSYSQSPKADAWRWRRWLALAVILLIAAAVFHPLLLRGAACLLIADDGAGDANDVVVLWCEHCFDRASELYRDGEAARFHYIEPTSERLVSLGVSPSWGELCVAELGRRGVPSQAISEIPGAAREPWGFAHSLHAWLRDNPESQVRVLCSRLESGAVRYAFSSVLGDDEFERVGFWCPADPRFDEHDWWQSGAGRREFATALFTQAYFWLHGEDSGVSATMFDPDAYERGLN